MSEKVVSSAAVSLADVKHTLDCDAPNTPILSPGLHCITRLPSSAIPPTCEREETPESPALTARIAVRGCAEGMSPSAVQPENAAAASKPDSKIVILDFIKQYLIVYYLMIEPPGR